MSISSTLDEAATVGFIHLLSDWGVSVPTHQDNLERLKLWRSLLVGMTVEQRAQAAGNIEILRAVLSYVPSKDRHGGRARDLDWNGLDPALAKYDADREALRGLAHEQEQWISQGLIQAPTTSSTEWPLVALLEAAEATNQPSPHLPYVVTQAIARHIPTAMEKAGRALSSEEWQAILKQPHPGSDQNPPLLFSLIGQPEAAKKVLPFLPASLVDMRHKDNSNGFFGLRIPVEDIPVWVKAGMDPCARDTEGRFAEEREAYRKDSDALTHLEVLNSYRTRQEQRLAMWRFSVAAIVFGLTGQDHEKPLIQALLSPSPADDLTGSTVIAQLERSQMDSDVPLRLIDFMKNVLEPRDLVDQWSELQGGHACVAAFLLACGMKEGAPASSGYAMDLAQRGKVSSEALVLHVLKTPANDNLQLAAPTYHQNRKAYNEAARAMLGADELLHPQAWVELLPHLEAPLLATAGMNNANGASVINLLAHVLPRLPQDELFAEANRPALWALAVARGATRWNDLADLLPDGFPVVDKTGLDHILNEALEMPGVGQWWKGQKDWLRGRVESQNSGIASRLNGAMMRDTLPGATPTPSPKPRF